MSVDSAPALGKMFPGSAVTSAALAATEKPANVFTAALHKFQVEQHEAGWREFIQSLKAKGKSTAGYGSCCLELRLFDPATNEWLTEPSDAVGPFVVPEDLEEIFEVIEAFEKLAARDGHGFELQPRLMQNEHLCHVLKYCDPETGAWGEWSSAPLLPDEDILTAIEVMREIKAAGTKNRLCLKPIELTATEVHGARGGFEFGQLQRDSIDVFQLAYALTAHERLQNTLDSGNGCTIEEVVQMLELDDYYPAVRDDWNNGDPLFVTSWIYGVSEGIKEPPTPDQVDAMGARFAESFCNAVDLQPWQAEQIDQLHAANANGEAELNTQTISHRIAAGMADSDVPKGYGDNVDFWQGWCRGVQEYAEKLAIEKLAISAAELETTAA